jgi:hypothetical protein
VSARGTRWPDAANKRPGDVLAQEPFPPNFILEGLFVAWSSRGQELLLKWKVA